MKLPRNQRLKTPADFQRVYASKQWGGSDHFTFNVNAAEHKRTLKVLGVTVSKKVSNRAVDRNRIKRQIKEFYRRHQHQLVFNADSAEYQIELVITAKPSSLAASDEQRQDSLESLWSKVLKWHRWHQRQA